MTVQELIDQLSKFPPQMEVFITDGYDARVYHGEWAVKEFIGTVDIGVGGTSRVYHGEWAVNEFIGTVDIGVGGTLDDHESNLT